MRSAVCPADRRRWRPGRLVGGALRAPHGDRAASPGRTGRDGGLGTAPAPRRRRARRRRSDHLPGMCEAGVASMISRRLSTWPAWSCPAARPPTTMRWLCRDRRADGARPGRPPRPARRRRTRPGDGADLDQAGPGQEAGQQRRRALLPGGRRRTTAASASAAPRSPAPRLAATPCAPARRTSAVAPDHLGAAQLAGRPVAAFVGADPAAPAPRRAAPRAAGTPEPSGTTSTNLDDAHHPWPQPPRRWPGPAPAAGAGAGPSGARPTGLRSSRAPGPTTELRTAFYGRPNHRQPGLRTGRCFPIPFTPTAGHLRQQSTRPGLYLPECLIASAALRRAAVSSGEPGEDHDVAEVAATRPVEDAAE